MKSLFLRLFLAATLAVAATLLPLRAGAEKAAAAVDGHVYLIRGLGNFWSRGIDQFKAELDSLGVPNTVFNYRRWEEVAAGLVKEARAGKKPPTIIIVAHSYGADAGVIMSNWLGERGVPVRLLVTFDGRNRIAPLGNNAAELIDYFKPPFGRATKVAANFKGPHTVTDLAGRRDITHDSIVKRPEFHKAVNARILAILKRAPKA